MPTPHGRPSPRRSPKTDLNAAAIAPEFAARIIKVDNAIEDLKRQYREMCADGAGPAFRGTNPRDLTSHAARLARVAATLDAQLVKRETTWGIAHSLNEQTEADLIGSIKGLIIRSLEGA